MPKKRRPLVGSAFGEDGGENPWKLSSVEDFVGNLDRKPTNFFRRKKK